MMMITIGLLVLAYASVSFFSIRALFRVCERIQRGNLRLLGRSASLALFLTPTISVPAALPVPAVLQILVGFFALHPGVVLVGLLPMVVAIGLIFLFMKAAGLLARLRASA